MHVAQPLLIYAGCFLLGIFIAYSCRPLWNYVRDLHDGYRTNPPRTRLFWGTIILVYAIGYTQGFLLAKYPPFSKAEPGVHPVLQPDDLELHRDDGGGGSV